MTKRDPDLDRLDKLLGQCLGRIDEQAFRLQDIEDHDDGFEHADALEHETAMLHGLVEHLLGAAERADHATQTDLNRIVEAATTACVAELGVPIVARQRLETGLPPVACSSTQIAQAVRRALVLAAEDLDVGGELIVTTRREDDTVVFEIESRGLSPSAEPFLRERAETLGDFVQTLDGRFRVGDGEPQSRLLLIELPLALATGEL